MARWTLERAARLGYLAGRGASAASILEDETVGAVSERAIRCAASRWGVALGTGAAFSVPLSLDDRRVLEDAADARGISTSALATAILHVVAEQRLFAAVLDDDP